MHADAGEDGSCGYDLFSRDRVDMIDDLRKSLYRHFHRENEE